MDDAMSGNETRKERAGTDEGRREFLKSAALLGGAAVLSAALRGGIPSGPGQRLDQRIQSQHQRLD